MPNAQEWLNEHYPENGTCQLETDTDNFDKKRSEIKKLDISNKDLEGKLDLKDFINLNKLECNGCQLTNLLVNDCKNLTEIDCSYNNSLAGSCEVFQNLNELKKLNINYTQIDSGLEYLPESLEKIYCKNTKLQKELEDYEEDIVSWREFYGQSQKWIDKNYPKETRKKIVKLDISKKSLEKGLRLQGFANLEELNCSGNQLVKLELDDCQNLRELDISNCLFLKGSLEFLKNLNNLEELNITNTNLSEGLECLPINCKRIICNCGRKKIVEELEKSGCLVEKSNYYDFVKFSQWREKKQNGMIAKVIPLERLYVIRGNIRQFLKKWGKRHKSNWWGWHNKPNRINIELERLKSPSDPDELRKHRWTIYGIQLIGRGSAVAGAILTFKDQSAIGGGILGIYPIAELIVSKLEESLKSKENKWKEFLTDADILSDNFNELSGIMTQFKISELKGGKVNEMLKNLDKKVTKFLKVYDENGDNEIDVEELRNRKSKLVEDLSEWDEKKKVGEEGSKLQAVMNAIKELEKTIVEYRQISYYGMIEVTKKEENNSEQLESRIEIPPR